MNPIRILPLSPRSLLTLSYNLCVGHNIQWPPLSPDIAGPQVTDPGDGTRFGRYLLMRRGRQTRRLPAAVGFDLDT
jgi:hypothetical protein